MPKKSKSTNELSHDTKVIITVLTLLFVFPIGVILMFYWKMFPVWVRILIILPITLFILLALFMGFFYAFAPRQQIYKARCISECRYNMSPKEVSLCFNKCNRVIY
jgi:protein-S-isoprenylcysteine O-methyltransferase Ste14